MNTSVGALPYLTRARQSSVYRAWACATESRRDSKMVAMAVIKGGSSALKGESRLEQALRFGGAKGGGRGIQPGPPGSIGSIPAGLTWRHPA